MKKIYIHFSIFVLFLAIILVISGCGRKNAPVAENNLTPALSSEEREKTETATSTEDVDTSDWKVYRNTEYGFELRYPNGWTVIKLSDPKAGFCLKSSNYKPLVSGSVIHSGEIYLNKTKNYDNLEIIDLINTFDDTSRFWPQKFPYRELETNGRKTVIFDQINDTTSYTSKEVFIKSTDYVFSISYLYKTKDENIEKIFGKIIESLKLF